MLCVGVPFIRKHWRNRLLRFLFNSTRNLIVYEYSFYYIYIHCNIYCNKAFSHVETLYQTWGSGVNWGWAGEAAALPKRFFAPPPKK